MGYSTWPHGLGLESPVRNGSDSSSDPLHELLLQPSTTSQQLLLTAGLCILSSTHPTLVIQLWLTSSSIPMAFLLLRPPYLSDEVAATIDDAMKLWPNWWRPWRRTMDPNLTHPEAKFSTIFLSPFLQNLYSTRTPGFDSLIFFSLNSLYNYVLNVGDKNFLLNEAVNFCSLTEQIE